MNRALTVGNRIYGFLLFAYPRQFRRRHGPEMASLFAENCSETDQSSGLSGVFAAWCAAAQDVFVSVCAEHVSQFLGALKWDWRALSGTPAFAAACGALSSILFFDSRIILTGGFTDPPRTQALSFAIASLNLALLWAASVVALHVTCSARVARCFGDPVFLKRVRAFRHLASIALFLSLCPTLKAVLANSDIFSALRPLPGPEHWMIGPLTLFTILLGFFLLEPLLTPRSRFRANIQIHKNE
ncbi:MAG: hypothetical protein DMG15_19300 [Acidobacteria bacterium]|nr:MAG: hypothetical protein DMG15_19300 [Acidobacteriota bacterium]